MMQEEQFDLIIEKLESLESQVLLIRSHLREIKSEEFLERMQSLRDSFELDQERYAEIHKNSLENSHRLNAMSNELKGIVSMTRACLRDKRKDETYENIKNLIHSLDSCQQNNSPLP